MTAARRFAVTASALLASAGAVSAQDLYDTTVLRTFAFTFHDANWLTLLRQNYQSQTDILADLTVDGVTYTNVGVRIRGNTSYTALPQGSQKFSLNVDMDDVETGQELMGYDSLNLNNGFHDPTFCREVLYNNYVAQFIPNPRANHVVVTLNGENWGVYINVQQFDKTMLSRHFPDTNGLRIKCANNPNGPGLRYNGPNPSGYTGYEIKADGGLADPWAPLIAVCNSVTNEPLATWQNIDTRFAIDPSIWSVVLENFLTDDDSYVNKGADFLTYRNPTDERMYLLQTDANETFTQTTWSITRNFNQTSKPVLNRVLAVPELRQRYMAHYRTVKQDMNWAYFEPQATALRNLIDAAVQADPKKLYSYTLFQQNFTSTVNLPYSGPAGGTLIGLQQFVNQRATFLNGNAELNAAGPVISAVEASDSSPDPFDAVSISATVTPAANAISRVELFHRPSPTGVYQRVQMTNVGGSLYSAPLPIAATPGQRVAYYVAAFTANTYSSVSYLPELTEWEPLSVEYTFGSTGGMRITEWMYSGASGEFIEFTNMSAAPVDMTGWSMDDDHAEAGAFDLSAFGVVQPGESVVVTESDAAAFRTAWSLAPSVKVIGNLGVSSGNNFARNDEINLFDGADLLVDRLTYGDQTFPGTIRTQNASGQTCVKTIGQDDVTSWTLSVAGDTYGTFTASTGERGTPGSYSAPSCNGCIPPSIDTQPVAQTACSLTPVSFSVIADGSGPLEYQWRVQTAPGEFTNLKDGPLAGIGTVSGSSSASITISGLNTVGATAFQVQISNGCGEITSVTGSLAICAADFDCSGTVNSQDFFDFLTAFFAEAPNSDFNVDGTINSQDFFDYLSAFFVGC